MGMQVSVARAGSSAVSSTDLIFLKARMHQGAGVKVGVLRLEPAMAHDQAGHAPADAQEDSLT